MSRLGTRVTATFPALHYRDLRVLALGSALGSFGQFGEVIALGWLVLDRTDSPFMVGLAFSLQALPSLFGIPAGALADSVDRRRLLPLSAAAVAIPLGALGLLIAFDLAEIWAILTLAFLAGNARASYNTARMSYAYDIVGAAAANQGLALISLAARVGALASPIVGIVAARSGIDTAYFVISGTYLLTAAVMSLARSRGRGAPPSRGSAGRGVRELFTEAQRNRVLLTLIVSTALLEVLGISHKVLLPIIAKDVLGVGVDGLGVMTGVGAAGGILGIAALFVGDNTVRNGSLYVAVILALGVSLALLGGALGSLLVVLAVLAVVNAMIALADILSQSLIQLSVPNALRGRAMGSWTFAIGAGPIGSLEVGALASFAGVTSALAFNGLGLVALSAAIVVLVPQLRRM